MPIRLGSFRFAGQLRGWCFIATANTICAGINPYNGMHSERGLELL